MSKLLIVESPAKAKTIGKYLGPDFIVKSSVGHVRDLPKKGGIGIKIAPDGSKPGDWTFTPTYEITPEKKKVVEELRKAAKGADEIFLAPDPDREGEAIAWHLEEVLAGAAKGKPVRRVTYNEITKNAVLNAVAHPGKVDMARVDAQQARRILDRLVGFQVSPLLWRYLNYGRFLSAGRVQSAALRMLVEREREISGFSPVAYWLLGVEARKGQSSFTARLARIDGEKPDIRAQEQAAALVDDLNGSLLRVSDLKIQQIVRKPMPPFTTSTLQQAASGACGFSPHRTMSIAQSLYESGLITYMRTDSVNVAEVARKAAAEMIAEEYGSEYLPSSPNVYKSRGNAQEAHEAIRPTDVRVRPGQAGLDAAAAKLYDLIWRRFTASQMAAARFTRKTAEIAAEKGDGSLRHDYLFTASVTDVEFEGFLKAMPAQSKKRKDAEEEESDEVGALPPLAKGDELEPVRWLSDRKETKPPPRFSEASLVKTLEENGVGRPSTYAQIIETLVNRQYAVRESRQLVPTRRGTDVNDWLVTKLSALFDVGYTAKMEEQLDKVESGEEKCNEMLSGFYRQFNSWMAAAREPPPPREKFEALFSLLASVRKWRVPAGEGKRLYDDLGFVESVKRQLDTAPDRLSDRQLAALAKLVISYGDQIPGAESKLEELGYGALLDRAKNAPSSELVKWCFLTLDRIGGMQKNPFICSLREQVDRGRTLSSKQFAILARSVGENSGALPDADEVRARLAPYVPEGFSTAPDDPAVPEILKMLESVKEWRPPAKRGRKVYNDRDFVESLREQYSRRRSLSPRQATALRRLTVNYRQQLPGYDEAAERLGLNMQPPAGEDIPKKPGARKGRPRRQG